MPLALTNEFLEDASKKVQWTAFLKRMGLAGKQPTLPEVGHVLVDFLMPVVAVAAGALDSHHVWTPPGPWK